jgi:hypothetical protein
MQERASTRSLLFYPMRNRSALFLCLAILVLAACAGESAAPPGQVTSTPVTPIPGKGSVSGRVVNAGDTWPDMNVIYIFAAPFSGDASGKGIYFLDPSVHPQAALETGGNFQLANLTPQRYVLVVGPRADTSRPLLDEQGKTRIVEVKSGELLQLGQVKVGK